MILKSTTTLLPQALETGASPTFTGLTIGSLGGIIIGTAGVLSAITNNSTNWNLAVAHISESGSSHSDVAFNTSHRGLTALNAHGATANDNLVMGGNVLYGNSTSGGGLTLSSTSHATKGKILFGTSAYNEVNNRLGIGITTPLAPLHLPNNTAIGFGNTPEVFIDYDSANSAFEINTTSGINIALLPGGSGAGVGVGTSLPNTLFQVVSGETTQQPGSTNDIFGVNLLKSDFADFIRGALFIVERKGTLSTVATGTMGLNAFVYWSGNETSTSVNIAGGRYGITGGVAGTGSLAYAKGVTAAGFVALSGNATSVTRAADFWGEGAITMSGTIANAYNFYGEVHADSGSGSITNAYGIYLEQQTVGATSNYQIYSAGGASLLNAGTATIVPLILKGAASQSANLQEWQKSDGTIYSLVDATGNFNLNTSAKLYLRSANNGIYSQATGYMDLFATTAVRIGNSSAGAPSTYLQIAPDGTTSVVGANLVLPKTTGIGIKVDTASPTFGWRDIEGQQLPDVVGTNRPTMSAFIGGSVRANAYTAGDKMDCQFHIPHDYVPGTHLYFHVHWAHNGTAISGNIVFTLAFTYAKGHNQANYASEKTLTITYDTVNITTTPRYRHRIDEVQGSTSGGSGTTLDSDAIEIDGIIQLNLTVTTIPTITGGSPDEPFVMCVDLHYQSSNIASKQKAPAFYT